MQSSDRGQMPEWSIEIVHKPYVLAHPDFKGLEQLGEHLGRLIRATIEAQCSSVFAAQAPTPPDSNLTAKAGQGLTLMERMS